ncbi:unnamed protein product [Closterium sp. NIES-53]
MQEMVRSMDGQGHSLANSWWHQLQQQSQAAASATAVAAAAATTTGQGMPSANSGVKERGWEGAQEGAYTECAYKERSCMEVDVQESMSLVALDVTGLVAFGSVVTHEGGQEERRRKEGGGKGRKRG